MLERPLRFLDFSPWLCLWGVSRRARVVTSTSPAPLRDFLRRRSSRLRRRGLDKTLKFTSHWIRLFLAYYASISNQHLRQCGRHNCIDITLYKTLRRCIIVRDVMASKYHVKDVIALMHYIVQDVFT